VAAGSPYLRVTYAETNRILPEPYQRVLVACIALAALALPAFGNAYLIYLLNLTFLAIIGAVGLNLLTGYCGQVSLGHASFLAIGAFVTAILSNRYGAPVWQALPAACGHREPADRPAHQVSARPLGQRSLPRLHAL
jgi:branched-chain amino acid transport system permease protein